MNFGPDTRASLIVRLRKSDDVVAWNEFVELYQAVVYRLARKRGLQHDDAVEITQEVFTRVASAVDRWDPDPQLGSFRGWLGRITRNLVISFLRKKQRRPYTTDDAMIEDLIQQQPDRNSPDACSFDLELERQIFHAAAKRIRGQFQPGTWDAFWLSAVQNQPIEKVAQQLGMTRGAVYIARCRVMAKLKEEVQQMLHETQY